MYSNTSGKFNIAIGTEALYSDISGSYNTAVGYQSLYNDVSGNYNTAIGYQAGQNNSTTINNTILIGPDTKLTTNKSGIVKFSEVENTSYPATNQFWFGDPLSGWINVHAGTLSKSLQPRVTPPATYTHRWDTSGSSIYATTLNANFTLDISGIPTLANQHYTVELFLVQPGTTGYYATNVTINGTSVTKKPTAANFGFTPSTISGNIDVETFNILCTATNTYTVLAKYDKYV